MNKNIYKKMLDFYRDEYEDFIGVSSFDTSLKSFTLEEQIMRYAKHLSFWYMKLDQLKKYNPTDIDDHKIFLKFEISRAMTTVRTILPTEAVKKIITMIVETRKIQNHILLCFEN